jgi:hypothetical protein
VNKSLQGAPLRIQKRNEKAEGFKTQTHVGSLFKTGNNSI